PNSEETNVAHAGWKIRQKTGVCRPRLGYHILDEYRIDGSLICNGYAPVSGNIGNCLPTVEESGSGSRRTRINKIRGKFAHHAKPQHVGLAAVSGNDDPVIQIAGQKSGLASETIHDDCRRILVGGKRYAAAVKREGA